MGLGSLRSASVTSVKRTVLSSPIAPHVRRVARLVEPAATRRDRRDNDALTTLIAATLAGDASAIDVGANEGRVLEDLVRVAPTGRHLAYEPIPALHADLERRFPDVDVRCAALADKAGESEFTHVTSRPGYSGLKQRDYPGREQLERITVRIERLDDALPPDFVPTFIKIDVEGAEEGVLRGAINTLERHRPTIAFEHGKGAAGAYGTTPDDVYELLVGIVRLRIYDMDGVGPFSRDQFVEAYELGTRWNFFARI